jgi:hypothetical protein
VEREPYIQDALRREIAGNLWGLEARYRVYLETDLTLAAAMEHFPEAELMCRLYGESLDAQR